MNKTIIALALGVIVGCLLVWVFASPAHASACGWFSDCSAPAQPNATQASNQVAQKIAKAVPIPQLTNSSERVNVSKRAVLFDDPNKISYIYLVSFGKVMAFYTVQGKVSSLRSYMTPEQKLIEYNGDNCTSTYYNSCYVVDAPDIDGTYGENVDGIFFFTTEGAYVEWKGDYMMSDQPLKLSTQPELVRQIN